MKRAKGEEGSNSMDKISELPQEILQRILYLLTQEEAVRTSVLSKSWRYIWCTRPNLDFSDATFNGNKQDFLSAVTDSLRRYYDQRLSLEEFHLRISLGDSWEHESVLLLEKWIPTLTNMGTKKFRLSIRSGYSPGIIKLPSVIFEAAESLQDLHLEGFELDRKTIESIVLFKHVKRLRLQRVSFEVELFQKIITWCPSIETLDVIRCTRLRTINVYDLHNLKHFTFSTDHGATFSGELCSIKIHPPSLKTIIIFYGNLSFQKGAEFRDLNDLYLLGVESSSLEHLSSCKFPSLERLTLSHCHGLGQIKLFIDAPKIKHFAYHGLSIPSISFAKPTSKKWRSHISLHAYNLHPDDASSWFLKLKDLLRQLSQSEITLDINQYPRNDEESINLVQGIMNGCNQPIVVESLGLLCHSSSIIPSLLNALLWVCRPRNIADGLFDDKWETEVIRCLWDILMKRESSGDQDDQFRRQCSWLQDLEEVSMEIHDDNNRKEWHPISSSELPNDRERESIRTRFALKWRQDQDES